MADLCKARKCCQLTYTSFHLRFFLQSIVKPNGRTGLSFLGYVAVLTQKFIIILLEAESYLNTISEFSTVCSLSKANKCERQYLRLVVCLLELSGPLLYSKFNLVNLLATGLLITKATKRPAENGRDIGCCIFFMDLVGLGEFSLH